MPEHQRGDIVFNSCYTLPKERGLVQRSAKPKTEELNFSGSRFNPANKVSLQGNTSRARSVFIK